MITKGERAAIANISATSGVITKQQLLQRYERKASTQKRKERNKKVPACES